MVRHGMTPMRQLQIAHRLCSRANQRLSAERPLPSVVQRTHPVRPLSVLRKKHRPPLTPCRKLRRSLSRTQHQSRRQHIQLPFRQRHRWPLQRCRHQLSRHQGHQHLRLLRLPLRNHLFRPASRHPSLHLLSRRHHLFSLPLRQLSSHQLQFRRRMKRKRLHRRPQPNRLPSRSSPVHPCRRVRTSRHQRLLRCCLPGSPPHPIQSCPRSLPLNNLQAGRHVKRRGKSLPVYALGRTDMLWLRGMLGAKADRKEHSPVALFHGSRRDIAMKGQQRIL